MSSKREPTIMIPSTTKQGYKRVNILGHQTFVHRLVAEAFVPGYFKGAIVNHIDEDPANNCADNLEWCNYSYNNKYGNGHENRKITKGAAVRCYDDNGNLIGEFYSIAEAGRVLGCSHSGISQCFRKKDCRFHGLRWEKVKEANTHAG